MIAKGLLRFTKVVCCKLYNFLEVVLSQILGSVNTIFICFPKAHKFEFTRIKDHILVMEPIVEFLKVFLQTFLNWEETYQ